MDDSTGANFSKTTRHDVRQELFKKHTLEKKVPTLVVLRGSDAGLRIPLIRETATLGRTIDSEIVLDDELISRRHAAVSLDAEKGTYFLTDLDSTNGTMVNYEPVRKVELRDGDKLFLGSTILKFVLEDDVEAESNEIVDRLMFQDDLTGLVVKRRFYNEFKVQLQSAVTLGTPLSALMMDMDGLKKVNDTHGHAVGAFIISEVGKIIGEFCNPQGQACRYGGDEFVAYLHDACKEYAITVAEEIRLAVRKTPFEKDGLNHRVSISIGVATFPDDARTLEALTEAADQALYRAKEKGRNNVSD
jgi:two-component system cell cycle response regulator